MKPSSRISTRQDDPGSNTLEVHIHNLRRKLGKDRIKPFVAWVIVWRDRNEQYASAINGFAGGDPVIFQLISVIWLWHESREQIGFLVNETLSAKARNNHVEKRSTKRLPRCWSLPVMVGFTLLFSFWAVTDNSSAESAAGQSGESFGGQPHSAAHVFRHGRDWRRHNLSEPIARRA